MVLLMVMLFNTLGCNKVNKIDESNADSTENAEDINDIKSTKINDLKEAENDTNTGNELAYNKSKTLEENAKIMNRILEEKYGKSFTLSTDEDYVKAGQADWTLILKDNRVGIDTSTWKFDYDSNTDDGKYMDAILEAFSFFCGEEMGNSLWSLTGDLLDGGADETLYGFVHNGSKVIYKNGDIATFESGNNKSAMYIWLTPIEY
ncbi:hypothetical protein [Anaeromicropila herbilytica]|uniref:Uncharacterized protein n=1 Tax=Anaeromicropila herbilytica TaxID=2785025 RepID=A0A7R7END0_9FIRM|nr:hypothetical protein [Anaeromicropila herbilytica]BCN31745.1 hypothetical protein bsdtb5_30400 [Anaeromicropila herbilytica]